MDLLTRFAQAQTKHEQVVVEELLHQAQIQERVELVGVVQVVHREHKTQVQAGAETAEQVAMVSL
jgi:hypothetical protein